MPARHDTAQSQVELAIDKAIGTRVMELRLARGMSQTDLGRLIDITFQQVQKYEKGANRISVSRLFSIAEALGVRPADLLSDAVLVAGVDSAKRKPSPLERALTKLSPEDQALVTDLALKLARRAR